MQCGQLLLAGKVPYVDFIEFNPPVMIYLNVMPAQFAALTGMPPALAFYIFVIACLVISIAACVFVVDGSNEKEESWVVAPTIVSLCALNLILCGYLGDVAFGQREHLFLLFYTPFFLLRWLRWRETASISRFSAILYGTLAGMGICIKPYFVILAVAPEIYWFATNKKPRRLLKPEMLAAIAVMVLYAVHFLFLPAAARENMFGRWLPIVAVGYNFCSYSLPVMLAFSVFIKGYVELLLLTGIPSVLMRRRCSLLMPLLCFSIASLAIWLLQAKSWSYQAIPFFFGVLVMFAIQFYLLTKKYIQSPFHNWKLFMANATTFGAAGAMLLLFNALFLATESPHNEPKCQALDRLVETKSRKGDSILVLSTGPGTSYPWMLNTGRLPGSRYLWCFPLPMIAYLINCTSDQAVRMQLGLEEQRVLNELAEDIERRKPRLVIVLARLDRRAKLDFDMFHHLEERNFFRSSMKNYVNLGRVCDCIVFERADDRHR